MSGDAFADRERLAETAEVFIGVRLREFHHHIFDGIGVRNLPESETLLLGSRLYIDIAEIEDGREEAVDDRRDILYAGEFELADLSREEPFLLDVDDALIGDDPDIEVVIDPDEERVDPHEQHECIEDEIEKARMHDGEEIGEDSRHGDEAGEDDDRNDDAGSVVHRYIEPMPMDDAEHLLVLVLALEMVAGKWRHSV